MWNRTYSNTILWKNLSSSRRQLVFQESEGILNMILDVPLVTACLLLDMLNMFSLAFPATDECLLLHCIFIPSPSAGISSGKGSIRAIVETFICDDLMMSHMTLCCTAPVQNLLTPNHGVQHKQFPEWKHSMAFVSLRCLHSSAL